MRATDPAVSDMADRAKHAERIGSHQKIAMRVAVWVVASGALEQTRRIEPHLGRKQLRIGQLQIRCRQTGSIVKANGVIVGEVRAQVGQSGRNEIPTHHADLVPPAQHTSERNRAIVAAQAEFARACGLFGVGIQSG